MDVLPMSGMRWLARCDCGATQDFDEQETAWFWLLDHPCGVDEPQPVTV